VLSAVATSRTNNQLTSGHPVPSSLTSGFGRALLVGSIFLLGAAVIALRTHNDRGESVAAAADVVPEPAVVS
jgi:hypothetical protein